MTRFILFLCLSLFAGTWALAQATFRLYNGKAPGSEHWTWTEQTEPDSLSKTSMVTNIVNPSITAFLPEKSVATSTAILIFPGGKRPNQAPRVRTSVQAALTRPNAFRVSGTVRDSATGLPLSGVAIVIDYRKHLSGTNTNAEGHYTIEVPSGNHILIARLVGYTPVRKEIHLVDDSLMVDVALISVASQLEEVVVTTKGFDQTLRQPMLGANQLNINTLKKLPSALGEVDLLRGLQMLPGVTSVGEASNGVNIRGGTTDQNLILLDETPIFNPTHMFGLFSVFPPDVMSTVDLYKGNVPARFGGRAASVLDVSLRNPTLDQFSLSGGVSVVSNKLTADLPIVPGKFGLLISGRGAFNDFLLPIVSDRLANIRAKFGDGVLKAFWRIDNRNTLTVTGYTSLDLFRTDLLANLPNVTGTSTRYNHQTINVMARWFRTLSSRLNWQTTGVYGYYIPKILSSELSGNLVTLRSSVLQRQLKSNLNYQLTNQKLEFGISGTHYQLEPGTLLPGQSDQVNYVTTPTEKALELALYADYERSLGTRLAISAGLRFSQFLALGPSLVRHYRVGEPRDDFSVTDSTRYAAGQITQRYGGPEPRLGIRYTLGANSSVKFGYNLMRQYLQVVTNTTTPLPTSRWKTSDPNVRPQVSQLVTAGLVHSFKNNIYELTLEGYYRFTQHIIDYRPGADFLLQPYPETQLLQGRSKAYGVESMISKKKGELTGWLSYTYARTLNQVNEGPTVQESVNNGNWYRANYDRPHAVNANMTIDVDRHNSFSFTFAYSTGRPYSTPTGFVTIDGAQYPYYGVRNNSRLPDYHRLDFSWNIYNPGMKARRWEGRWAFTVYNLYGKKNAYSIFFKAENGKTNAYQLQIFAAPIASLSYNFVFK
ncbi:TonB-dependent receptor [Spirosoma fluviale]|uniref:TonB-dependent Receptor Plug Domain n=1 Tax=Spirosoma fluviale TaxID=1597977 RepID=A0A286G5H4_9BACT|nr:TonB-dependent receptor [Spirosoma fluviale]SOD90476.1 TonB-dependent Receptor Plug Domain [Spirosoma fluviale]